MHRGVKKRIHIGLAGRDAHSGEGRDASKDACRDACRNALRVEVRDAQRD